MRTVKLTKESTKDILENLLKRSPNNYGKFESTVAQILDKVKNEGDAALFAYTKEFDKADVTKETIRVTDAEIEEAYAQIDPALLGVIRKALVNIRQYHEKQIQNSWFTSTTDGTMLGQKVTPLNRVGVYVPGGKAVYPSSVLMNIVPAKVAGVPHIVMTTPPGKKVSCHKMRISCLICKNKDLTRSCNGVNAYIAIYCFLCKSYENVSGTYDLVYLRNTLCSESKGTDRLCTTHLINLICSCFFGCYQCGICEESR